MFYRVFIPLWAICLPIAAPPAQATEIYSHAFGGDGTVFLNGLAPDVDNYNGGGNLWLAGDIFLDDGWVGHTSHGAAILPFVPVDGNVYTLEANILPATTPDNTGWIAVGFLENNNDGNPNLNLARHSNAGGWAWQIVRNSAGWDDQVALNGRNAATPFYFTGDFVDATVPVATKTVLDTTGGAGNWTAEYFLNDVSQGAPATLSAGASNIQFVGFSQSRGGDGGGNLNSFALSGETSVVSGDFNGSGVIDAADYAFWRDRIGTQAGYDAWRANFGAVVGSGTAVSAVPEPAVWAMIASALIAAFAATRRQRRFRIEE